HMARGIGGTGLGLYICRELVRRVNGRIWVESEGGRGATFFVEIPQEQASTAGASGGGRHRAPARAA
ncbi:MAG: sensor histidine kinase, partial [Gaiellaceae bacterium]